MDQTPLQIDLDVQKHVRYIQELDTVRAPSPPLRSCRTCVDPEHQQRDDLEYWFTEHLRLSGLYWGLTALHLLGHPDALPRQEIITVVLSCQHPSGGFGAAPGHDPHMLYTVSAVQVLVLVDALDALDEPGRGGRAQVGNCIAHPTRSSCLPSLTVDTCLSYSKSPGSIKRYLLRRRVG